MLTFGGLLVLGGRLGDLYGYRKLFIGGIVLFTLASLVCGVANSQTMLLAARAVQGVGGAVVTAVALSLLMHLFTEPGERAKAMGFYGFVCSSGGSVGVLLGGLLTGALNWHWVFLVNLPVGIAVILLTLKHVPVVESQSPNASIDVTGAISLTLALVLAVYAIVNGNDVGWLTAQTLGLLALAAAIFVFFIIVESRVQMPLVPLALFKLRSVTVANIIGVLWSAAMFAWFFMSALYLQLVLGYTPLQIGLSFLPANLLMAAFSIGISARLVNRFGTKKPLWIGLAIAAAGLALFARAPIDGHFVVDVLPNMLLLGLGGGIAFNPILLVAMGEVQPKDSGLASGLVNTSFMMGGALGLAVLASVAVARTSALTATGASMIEALNGGYHAAFFVGTLFAGAAALLGAVFLRDSNTAHHE
jgi:EmrB/QacA subfamily drug resistance transporter